MDGEDKLAGVGLACGRLIEARLLRMRGRGGETAQERESERKTHHADSETKAAYSILIAQMLKRCLADVGECPGDHALTETR